MKKWAPYKSLPEQDPHLINMRKNKKKIDKPTISNEEAERINEILIDYHGQKLKVTYFKNGELFDLETTIKKIDIYNQKLILEDISIMFNQLINLNEID